MSKSDTAFLRHILDTINQIEIYMAGLTYRQFSENRLIQDGVVRQLEVIGEASRSLSEELRAQSTDLPWQQIIGLLGWLAGTPVLRRPDAALDFSWGWGSPAPEVSKDDFSVRWTGSFPFEQGRYAFTSYSDDGVRVLVDGQPVIIAWRPMRGYRSGSVALAAGTHTVQVEYFDRSGVANLRVSWRKTGDVGVAPTPQSAAIPPTTSADRPKAACASGPLRLEAWPVGKACAGAGWTATIYVQASAGDCRYTYAWEGITRAGPVPGWATFQLANATRGTAMVGTVFVSSGGQTAQTGLYIAPPGSCN